MDKKFICSICGLEFTGFGNNPWPINDGRCCDLCNQDIVIPRRLIDLMRDRGGKEKELASASSEAQIIADIKIKRRNHT